MSVFMRRAKLADLDRIMVLERETFEADAWPDDAMRRELESPHGYYLVAVDDEAEDPERRLLGYAGLLAPADGGQGDIQTIAVAWAWYRAGNSGPLQVLTDARRREFAVSDYDGLDDDDLPIRLEGPSLSPRDDVPDAWGSRLEAHLVSAGAIGMLAELAFAARRLPLAADAPLYLRAPDVTPSAGKRVLR